MTDFLRQDFFTLFGLTATYRLDLDDLEHRYQQLQRAVHPDRHATAAAQDRRLAMQMTAKLNEAYTTLRSGLLRARYLLDRRGCSIEDNPAGLANDFLLQQISLREEIEEIRSAGDHNALLALRQRLQAREAVINASLAELFERPDDAGLNAARELFYEYQFLARLQRELDALLPSASNN